MRAICRSMPGSCGSRRSCRRGLLTNDQALGQVARLQQVPVLNLADLAHALRPVVVAGDELELNLVKEGRDPHQAVGYLPDGTMIVVNQGRPHIGRVATVVVSSALQTGGGRLIFAELKENARVRAALQVAVAVSLCETRELLRATMPEPRFAERNVYRPTAPRTRP